MTEQAIDAGFDWQGEVVKTGEGRAHSHGSLGILDTSSLCHPGWWVALVVLLVNDHLLKGGGILPGWLTGKLSDFAFLVVLPVLVASLMPARLLGRRTAAFTIVIGIFVAAKVSLSASNALVACAARPIRSDCTPDTADELANRQHSANTQQGQLAQSIATHRYVDRCCSLYRHGADRPAASSSLQ